MIRWHLPALVDTLLGAGTLLLLCRVPLPGEDFRPETVQSLRIYDRRGVLLRQCLNDGDGHAQWKSLKEIAPAMVEATIAVEDARFFRHPGIDPLAIGRAVVDDIRSGSLRSGGSTLTQQVIRNIYHRPRTLWSKLVEMRDALRLEGMLAKDQIVEQYLNRAPYGNQLIGVEAASESYFGKPGKDLSLAEAAFLAGLPNAPSVLNPRKSAGPALARQRTVLRRLLGQSKIGQVEYDRALSQPLHILAAESSLRAAHLTDMLLKQFRPFPGVAVIRTTIDYALQQQIQLLMQSHVRSLTKKNVTNAAAVVIDNATGEIRALVGSVDYFDDAHEGEVNGVIAPRQPGSSIKPLMYGLALERGFSAADILADVPTAIPDHEGEYVPENYDRKFHGPVRLRTALACSYNVPAVRVLREVGKDLFLQRLHETGITTMSQPADYYGYGMTLGNGEVTLLELTNAYAALANGGRWKSAFSVASVEGPDGSTMFSAREEVALRPPRQVYDERAAFLITNILSDPVARRPAFGSWFRFPFACAVKTGTTKDYRDNWTIGYTTQFTVGVWVGNFDGSVMHGVSGVTGAGQIFTDIMNLLHAGPTGILPAEFRVPDGLEQRTVCNVSGLTPGRYCRRTIREWFLRGSPTLTTCRVHQAFRLRGDDGTTVTKVFEVYPPEFSAWSVSERLPVPPPDAVRLTGPAPGRTRGSSLAILTPADGDIFKLDPMLRRDYQLVRIVGSVPDRCRDVRIRIDGASEMPYADGGIRWPLRRGRHAFQLVGFLAGRRVESGAVMISVE